MQGVSAQFAILKSDLDRLADNRTSVPITDPVTLGSSGGFRFASSGTPPAELAFAPPGPGEGLSVSSPQLRIQSQGGRAIYGGSETWITIVSGSSIHNVTAVDHVRLRIPTPASWATGNSVTLSVLGPGGAYAGKFVVRNIDHGATYTYEHQTFSSQSQTTPISIMQESYNKQTPPPYHYIDLLRSEFLFTDVLRAAPTPFGLELARQGMEADYTAAYSVLASGGTTQVGNVGLIVPNFQLDMAAGSLQLTSRNQQFPAQAYILEHGAVIVSQADGTVMAIAPQFTVSVIAGQVNLAWVAPALTGTSTAVAGPTQASVTFEATGERIDLVATAARISLTLPTAYASTWTQYWSETLQRAGLTSSGANPQFTTTTTATSATLDLFGLQSDPASTVDDISMTLKAASIHTTARASATGG